jgi:hypothetical protein
MDEVMKTVKDIELEGERTPQVRGHGNRHGKPLSVRRWPRCRPASVLRLFTFALAACLLTTTSERVARAETCTTQAGMAEPERDAMADAARGLAVAVQSNNIVALRSSSIAEIQKDFSATQYLVDATSPKLAGLPIAVEQVYLLDATSLKRNPDGSAPDAQFFCSLNRSTSEADFLIPSLPPGKYGFAIVNVGVPSTAAVVPASAAPWRLAMLLRQEPPVAQGKWLLAGFFPKPLTAAGHDGLWYWTQARQLTKDKQPWNAWLYYQTAQMLLRPADFVLSTHLDKLHTEQIAAAPPALSEGISVDAPLVVKGVSGAEFHFTSLTVDDSLGQSALDIAVHLRPDLAPDPSPDAPSKPAAAPAPEAARKRNSDAMAALLTAYPEMRKTFHGVLVYADAPGQPAVATELSMADIK